MSGLSAEEWRLKRARGAIEEYARGVKRRASDVNWVLGVLKGFFGASKGEALMIINQLKNDRTFVWDSTRLKRLEELEKRIKAEEW
jgi:hypothetical protein